MYRYPLLIVALLAAAPLQAGLFKCVDADGNITFTDGACPSEARKRTAITPGGSVEKERETQVRNEARVLDVARVENEARELCREGVLPFLRKGRPTLPAEAQVEVGRTLTRVVRGNNARLVFQGHVRYQDEGRAKETETRCTAIRLGTQPWGLQFDELSTSVYVEQPPAAPPAGGATPAPPATTTKP